MTEPKTVGEMFRIGNKRYFVGWMENGTYSMWLNEQPSGGFEFKFQDFKPEDESGYKKIYILAHDPRLV